MGIKLSQLTEATTFSDTDIFHLRTTGAIDKKITGANFNKSIFSRTIGLTSQTIDEGVSVKDCIYYDTSSSSWKKSAGRGCPPPQGIYIGSNKIVLFGYVSNLSGLTAGKIYWMKVDGTLSIDYGDAYSSIKMGFSLSTTELLIDIDVEADAYSRMELFGFYGGGWTGSSSNVIDYIDMILITGNAIDRGNLSVARRGLAGVSGSQYGFYGGGITLNVIDYIDMILTSGNAIDRGNLTVARGQLAGVSGPQYGFYGGGDAPTNVIDYIDLTLITGNAFDRGNLTVARGEITGVSGSLYGFYGGGFVGVPTDIIEYIDMILISGNAIDRGDLSVARNGLAGVSGPQYGFYGGGAEAAAYSDVIDYIDMTLISGNAIDRGNLSVARRHLAGISGSQYGFYGGGHTGVYSDVIDYIDMTLISGNATDRGDLTVARQYPAGVN